MSEQQVGIDGVRIGHWTDSDALTGCTVVLLPEGSCASYEVRGGAPATRELVLLEPDKAVATVDAVLLTGGSVFGLAAADGVVSRLEAQGRGVVTPAGPVPIVPTLGLFDLAVGDASVRPTGESGAAAVDAARPDVVTTGPVGAGCGAHFGHWREGGRRRGGIRYAERRHGDLVVGALVAVNAFGEVVGPDDAADAGLLARFDEPFDFGRENTTIGVVLTNARLDKVGCRIVAQGAHDGLARAITPPHSRFDGDGFVAVSTGDREAHVDQVRLLALGAVCDAIRSALTTPALP